MITNNKSPLTESQSRFLEMKSVQPYSTTDEYLYAMKEDLAEWLSSMYPEWSTINADNFLEHLENGVLLCQHANNLNNAARKSQTLKTNFSIQIENCKYRIDARSGTFNARDNVSQFIKWARRVVGVHEVLMFESDDLILRKNEKNFLLCLMEIARFGSKFGVRVPEIIQLEDEIEEEIQRDKQSEIMSFAELRRLQREEQQRTSSSSIIHEKCSKLLKFVRHEHRDPSKNVYNHFSISHSNGANWLRQRMSRIPRLNHSDRKKRFHSDDKNEFFPSEKPIEKLEPIVSRTLADDDSIAENIQLPTISSPLHKTVVQMTDSCCCAHRFPVVRIGEGKYRIGESGTIIFIRILRYHVMVRVGGGWDTLENYLNKHDPCRRTGAHCRTNVNDRAHEIPFVALSNSSNGSNNHRTSTFGKSISIKREEFPLSRTVSHDTSLTDAQLVITRDADGRHHIDQITYKTDEDPSSSTLICGRHSICSSPTIKVRSVRGTGRSTNCSSTLKEDDDTSLSLTSFMENPSVRSENLTENFEKNQIFDLTEIEEAQRIRQISSSTNDETTQMDEDSLDSYHGVIDEENFVLPPSPMIPSRANSMSKVKPGGFCTALYLAQKQKQTTTNKNCSNFSAANSKFEKISQIDSTTKFREPSERKLSNDLSRLERDSGFDEQDFRRERLQSAGDEDNSSFSSRRSSLVQSFSSENQQNYRENKAYELRLKALDFTRNFHEQIVQDFRSNPKKNFNYSANRNTETRRFRKNSSIQFNPK